MSIYGEIILVRSILIYFMALWKERVSLETNISLYAIYVIVLLGKLSDLLDKRYLEETFIPTIQKRGAAVIAARKMSSAMSAANAVADHLHDWLLGSDRIVSMSVPSDGSYGLYIF
jgi:malate/lactate dehydrogenase